MAQVLMFYISVASILANGYSLPAFGHTCLNSLTPPTNAKGVNRLDKSSNTALFQLEIGGKSSANSSGEDSVTYRVKISAEKDFPFSDAKISISSKGLCGIGSLTYDTQHFFDARQSGASCPRLLLTNHKLPMIALPSLTWRPPACGCIQFRAVVVSVDNVYYSDNEEVENGPLTQTVCVKQKATRELYLKALCHVKGRYSAAEIISRVSFQQRHQLDARWMDKHGLEMGLELRRSDNKLCCSKSSMEDKLTCFDDSRRRRVDRFCEDGYPDIPFTSFRLSHMREKEKSCCFLLGEHRYSCFAENSDLNRGPTVTILDFSQDETDPVNDLADFASLQDADIVKSVGTITFEEKEGSDDITDKDNDNSNDEKIDEIRNEQPVPKLAGTNTPLDADVNTPGTEGSREATGGHRDSQKVHRHSPVEGTRPSKKMTTVLENPTVASSEQPRKKTGRSGDIDRLSSAERVSSRRASSREYVAQGRRASGERAARKQGSGERHKPAASSYPRLPGYEDTYSRGTGLSRERDVLSSVERRARTRGSAQRRHDWPDAIEEPDFEDQGGGKSVDVTLDKLKRQMDRLHLRRQCCEAGASSGRPVYGWFSPVRKECEHSGQKYIALLDVRSGIRPCLDQFLKCCIEQAVSGPVASSSEFRDNQYLYVNNLKKIGPIGDVSQLNRLEEDLEQPPEDLQQEEISRDIPGGETPEAYELETERRFLSMRETEVVPKDNDKNEEEINGPKQFDEADNDNNDFDILDRKDETLNTANKTEEDSDELDNNDVAGIEDNDDDAKSGSFHETRKKMQESDKGSKKGNNRKEGGKDQLDRASDLDESMESQERGTSRSRDDALSAKTLGGRSYKNSRAGGRSRGGKSSSRESRQRASRTRSSQGASQERRLYARRFYGSNAPSKIAPFGKIGAQDSQEMAAANVRKYIGSLDSKEMIDAYRRTNQEHDGVLSDGPGPRSRSNRRRKHSRRTWYN